MLKKSSKFFQGALLVLLLLLTCLHCATEGDGVVCEADFVSNGFSLKVDWMSGNTYKFTICSNTSHLAAVYTVYGFLDESQILLFDPGTRARQSFMIDNSLPGSSFEVTFHDTDNWFAIFEDEDPDTHATDYEMARGYFRGQ